MVTLLIHEKFISTQSSVKKSYRAACLPRAVKSRNGRRSNSLSCREFSQVARP